MSGTMVMAVLVLATAPGCILFDDDPDGSGQVTDPELPPPEPEPEPLVQEEPFDESCLPDAWIESAASLTAPGTPVTFEIEAAQIRITTEGPAEIESLVAPLELALPEAALVVVPDAVVDGELVGTLVIEGATIEATSGTIAEIGTAQVGLDDAAVRAVPPPADDDGGRPDLGPSADPADVESLAHAHPHDVHLQDLQVSAFAAAWIVTDAEPIALTAPFSLSAERAYWPEGTLVSATSATAAWAGEVFIGLQPVAGEMVADGEPVAALPLSILGRDARLAIGPGRVATMDPMPVRTAMDADGALVVSDVELRICHAPTLVFSPGQTRSLSMAYRQRDGLTDAAFSDLVVETSGTGAMWSARVEVGGDLPAALTEPAAGHPECTWAQGITGFFEAWAEATAAIGRGVVCVFTFGFVCPDSGGSASSPPSLVPYPGWMEPAQMGEFQLELTAPTEPGTYAIEVRVHGSNYDAVVPATVLVR